MAEKALGNLIIFGAVAAIGGFAGYVGGIATYRLKKTIEYTPTSKAIAAAPGIVELAGIARDYKGHISPYNGVACTYYLTKLYRLEKKGKSSTYVLRLTLESPDPLFIEDDTGKALIVPKPEGKEISGVSGWSKNLVRKDSAETGRAKAGMINELFGDKVDPQSKMYKFINSHAPQFANDSHSLKVEETFIKDGDRIFVIGEGKMEEGENGLPMMKIVPDERRKIFCIADGDEKGALSTLGWDTMIGVFGSPFVVAFGAGLVSAGIASMKGLEIFAIIVLLVGAIAFFGMYAYAILMHILEFYNGTVALRTSVDRAKANVDALLKRRTELLPNLVAVVKEASKYEKDLQVQLASLRTEGMEADAKSLVALGEKYPELQANENYIELQRQLSKTEEWLAASRSYVSESIMLYNTRIMTLPYSLFAPLIGLAPMQSSDASN